SAGRSRETSLRGGTWARCSASRPPAIRIPDVWRSRRSPASTRSKSRRLRRLMRRSRPNTGRSSSIPSSPRGRRRRLEMRMRLWRPRDSRRREPARWPGVPLRGSTKRQAGTPTTPRTLTRTPATDVAVSPGTHRVDMDWGVYGARRDTVQVLSGGRVTLRPRLLGSVGFRSSDPSRILDVYVDGAYVGSTPVALDSIVVGRHLVRFGGPGLSSTAQEVEVLQ